MGIIVFFVNVLNNMYGGIIFKVDLDSLWLFEMNRIILVDFNYIKNVLLNY